MGGGSSPQEPYGPRYPEASAGVIWFESPEVYHSRREPSASDLKLLDASPLEYHQRKVLKALPKKDSPAMRYGERLHLWHEMLVGGEESFWDSVEIAHDDHTTATGNLSKKGEEWLANVTAEGKIGMARSERDKLWNQTRQILANDAAKRLFDLRLEAEFCGGWDLAGTRMRCRIDGAAETESGVTLYDLKTTSEESILKRWWSAVSTFRYDLQAAVYESFAAAMGWGNQPIHFIVTQTSPPYACYVVTLPRAVTARAYQRVLVLLDELRHRREWDSWTPEEYGRVVELECPSFMRGESNVNGW